jgi:glutamine cyclotransferase
MKRWFVALVSLCLVGLIGAPLGALKQESELPQLEILIPEIISVRPHDTGAFTQGLLLHDGYLYESAGQYGESDLRKVDPQTGEVLQQVDVPPQFFAEGLALDGHDRLIQLTWKEGVAFVYQREDFTLLGGYQYAGEGWGLCFDGQQLWRSDGSPTLYIHDPSTFNLTGAIQVSLLGVPVEELNELECVGDEIYANIWQSEVIVRIDKTSGQVNGVIQADNLLTPDEQQTLAGSGVLNGIAYDGENDVFYITGKLWPKLFEVRFKPLAGLQPTSQSPDGP